MTINLLAAVSFCLFVLLLVSVVRRSMLTITLLGAVLAALSLLARILP